MEHTGNPAGRGADGFRHGDGSEPSAGGSGRSIRPGTAVPLTVKVSDLGNGALFLHSWPVGPDIYLYPEDAGPLWRELVRAYGSEDRALLDSSEQP